MGFSVTIAEGQERGREYTFNQPEVSIGRVAENDIVLGDAGVSRKHVLIREEGGKYLVQDLGSANGTKLNGSAITEEELHDGDEISVGPVVFAFVAMPDAGENSTRIFNASELEQKMKATKEAKAKASAAAASNPTRSPGSNLHERRRSGKRSPAPQERRLGSRAEVPSRGGEGAPGGIAKKPAPPPGRRMRRSASERLAPSARPRPIGAKIKLKLEPAPR